MLMEEQWHDFILQSKLFELEVIPARQAATAAVAEGRNHFYIIAARRSKEKKKQQHFECRLCHKVEKGGYQVGQWHQAIGAQLLEHKVTREVQEKGKYKLLQTNFEGNVGSYLGLAAALAEWL